jgi:hypothetical protein
MPFYENATTLIRANLEAIQDGRKAKAVAIGDQSTPAGA